MFFNIDFNNFVRFYEAGILDKGYFLEKYDIKWNEFYISAMNI